MATNRYIGAARPIAQVDTFTPATITVGNTFTITSANSTTVVFTAAGTTAAGVSAGIVALLNSTTAPPPPEFNDFTWIDGVGTVVGTAKATGKPCTFTSAAATAGGSGTPTFVRTATTAPSGPSIISLAGNWSLGIPVNGQDLDFSANSIPLLYDLSYLRDNTIVPASATFRQDHGGAIGLPIFNSSGYPEYRTKDLQLDVATCNYAGKGSRVRLDFGSTACTLTINDSGNSADSGLETLLIKGTVVTLKVNKGSVAIGVQTGETGTMLAPVMGFVNSVGSDAKVRFGTGCTITGTLTMNGGQVQTNQALSAVLLNAGSLTHNTGTITAATATRGSLTMKGSTITTYIGLGQETLDLSTSTGTTLTHCTINKGSTLSDPARKGTYTNQIILNNCGVGDVSLDLGDNLSLAVTAL